MKQSDILIFRVSQSQLALNRRNMCIRKNESVLGALNWMSCYRNSVFRTGSCPNARRKSRHEFGTI
jgi:hypothetical protein